MTLLPVLSLILGVAHAQDGLKRGEQIYLKSCSQCHGLSGDGKGPGAARMLPAPRDFTTGAYKIRTTPNGEIPADGDLARAIAEGLPGSAMPAWKDSYTDAQIADVVAYIKTFSERFKTEKPSKVYSLKGAPRATAAGLAAGRKTFLEMQCNACHGMEARADGPSAPSLTDDAGNPIRPANLRKGWNFRGGHQVSDIFRTFMTGLNGTPMPSYIDALGDNPEGIAKAWDLANYVHSLSPDQPRTSEVVSARWHAGELPGSPSDPVWETLEPAGFLLFGQILEEPRQFSPGIDYLQVRSLYNSRELALLVEWDDPLRDPNPDQKDRPDALQLQFPLALYPDSQEGERPYFLEGDPGHPVNLWRWDSKSDRLTSLLSTGLSAEKTPVEQPASLFFSSSAYADGQWKLLLKRELSLPKEQGPSLEPGLFLPLAFSAWDGSNGDELAKRSISSWQYLKLEPQKSSARYAAPVLAMVLAGAAEFLFLRRRRKKAPPASL